MFLMEAHLILRVFLCLLSDFLNSLYRIILYPLVAYGVFRLIHLANHNIIDPWTGSRQHFLGTGSDLTLFLTHILTSFFGYVFAWTACFMTLRVIGFALPLLLSTPLAVILCLCTHLYHEFSVIHFLQDPKLYYIAILYYIAKVVLHCYFGVSQGAHIHIARSDCIRIEAFHSFPHDLELPHTFAMSQPKLPCIST